MTSQTTRLIEWFCSNDTGVSSKCLAAVMSGVNPENIKGRSAPLDPADLGRCLRLLDIFPEWKTRLEEMTKVNDHWARVIPHWEECAQAMENEVGIHWEKGRSAPKTYELMKSKGF